MIENLSAWHDLEIGTLENGFAGIETELTFNKEAVFNHIQRLADMAEEGLYVYGGHRGDSHPQFVNGDAAMWVNSSAYFGGFEADVTDSEFTQVPMPLDANVRSEPQNSIIGGATSPLAASVVAQFQGGRTGQLSNGSFVDADSRDETDLSGG